MEEQLKKYPDGARFSAIFLTDGCEYPSTGMLKQSLKNLSKQLQENSAKPSVIYCLGFSKDHDARLLNKLAQAGAKDDVPAASAALRGHVEEFYQLEPRRIQEKFGLSDL